MKTLRSFRNVCKYSPQDAVWHSDDFAHHMCSAAPLRFLLLLENLCASRCKGSSFAYRWSRFWGFLQLCLTSAEMVPPHCITASSETSCPHFSYYRTGGSSVLHKFRTALHCSWWLNCVSDVPDRCLTHSTHHSRLLHQIKSLIFITWATSIMWTAIMRPVIIDWSDAKGGAKKTHFA
jgi:hypothetical protein